MGGQGDTKNVVDDRTRQTNNGETGNLNDWAVAMTYGPQSKDRGDGAVKTFDRVAQQTTTPDNGTMQLLDGSSVRFENGRVAATTNTRGDTTTFHYPSNDKNAKIDSYQMTDKAGTVLEQAKRESNGVWSINGKQDWNIVDVKVGNRFSVEMTDKDKVVHARTMGGTAVSIDGRMPDQVFKDGRHSPAVTAEMTATGRRTDFHYHTEKGADGQPASVLDNYTVKDRDGHIKSFGVLRPDGKWLKFATKDGEQELDPAKVDEVKNLMRTDPNKLFQKKTLSDHVVGDTFSAATNVEVLADGRRIETHVNGTKTWEEANGRSRLVFARSNSDAAGPKQEAVDYDMQGNPIRLSERLTTRDGDGRPVTKDFTLTRQADGWYDQSGKKRDVTVESAKDGSLTITYGGSKGAMERHLNSDGSEVVSVPNQAGTMMPKKTISAYGTEVNYTYGQDGKPNAFDTVYPNGLVEHWRLKIDKNAPAGKQNVWVDELHPNNVLRGNPDVRPDGTVNWQIFGANGQVENKSVTLRNPPPDRGVSQDFSPDDNRQQRQRMDQQPPPNSRRRANPDDFKK